MKSPQTQHLLSQASTTAAGSPIPAILIVDDEQHIHSALRLRIGDSYRVISATDPAEALACVNREPLDLCIVDIHMPGMNGFSFIERAREIDPALGYVVLTAFDSDENLRRAIPLQILEFFPKPLPERSELERKIPDWIERTGLRRREACLAKDSERILHDLEVAQIERDVETTASDSAREALLQSATLLTTAQAVLLNTSLQLEGATKNDPRLAATLRNVQEARKQVEAAANITESYFGSAYADRDSSPALLDAGIRHASAIAARIGKAESKRQQIDFLALGRDLALEGLTGIEFLLLLVPALVRALELANAGTTLRITAETVARTDTAYRSPRFQDLLWVNRKHTLGSRPAAQIQITGSGSSPSEADASNWLRGQTGGQLRSSSRGLVRGIQKAKGLVGISVGPTTSRFTFVIILPI